MTAKSLHNALDDLRLKMEGSDESIPAYPTEKDAMDAHYFGSDTDIDRSPMRVGYSIRRMDNGKFLPVPLSSYPDSRATFPSEESALNFLESNCLYGISYEIVKVYYSFTSKNHE